MKVIPSAWHRFERWEVPEIAEQQSKIQISKRNRQDSDAISHSPESGLTAGLLRWRRAFAEPLQAPERDRINEFDIWGAKRAQRRLIERLISSIRPKYLIYKFSSAFEKIEIEKNLLIMAFVII